MAARGRQIDVTVRYTADLSNIQRQLKNIQQVKFNVDGGDLHKELVGPLNEAMSDFRKALSGKNVGAEQISKSFEDMSYAIEESRIRLDSFSKRIKSFYETSSNRNSISQLQEYERELKKIENNIDKWNAKYGKEVLAEERLSKNIPSTAQARNEEIKQLQTILEKNKQLTAQQKQRLEDLTSYNNLLKEQQANPKKNLMNEAAGLRTQINSLNTSTLTPSDYNTFMDAASMAQQGLNALEREVQVQSSRANAEIKKQIESQKEYARAVEDTKKKVTNWGTLFTSTFAGFSLSNIFEDALQNGIQFFKEYDETLTRTMMVTGMTRDEVNELTSSYNDLANQLASTTKDVAAAQLLFYQQGLGTQEALEMTEASVVIAKTGGIDTAEAADRLTAAVRGYQLSANEAMEIADKMSALDAAAASSVDELTVAMQKSASQARMAGLDLDYYMAYLSTMQEVTREAPENIGTAMKSITSRIQEITDIGKVEEDGTTFSNVAKALNSIGIAAVDASGQLRPLQDILDELGPMWSTLDRNHQAYIATVLAGNRQQSRFIALMDNYDRALELVNVSQNASGNGAKQLRAYNQGLESSLISLNNAWQQLATSLADSDAIKSVIDFVTDLIKALNGLPDVVVRFAAGFAVIRTALGTFRGITNIVQSLDLFKKKNMSSDIDKMNTSMQRSTSIMSKWSSVAKGLGQAFLTGDIERATKAIDQNSLSYDKNSQSVKANTSQKQGNQGANASEVGENKMVASAQETMGEAYEQSNDAIREQNYLMNANLKTQITKASEAIAKAREELAMTREGTIGRNETIDRRISGKRREAKNIEEDRSNFFLRGEGTKDNLMRTAQKELIEEGEIIPTPYLGNLFEQESADKKFKDQKKLIEKRANEIRDEYIAYFDEQEKRVYDEILRMQDEKQINIDLLENAEIEYGDNTKNVKKKLADSLKTQGYSLKDKDIDQLLSGNFDPLMGGSRKRKKQKGSGVGNFFENFLGFGGAGQDTQKGLDFGGIKSIFSDKSLSGIQKFTGAGLELTKVLNLGTIATGLMAGGIANMAASTVTGSDEVGEMAGQFVGLGTTLNAIIPGWGWVAAAAITLGKALMDELYPSAEAVEEKLTDLATTRDNLSQTKTNIEDAIETYEELDGKLNITEEEQESLNNAIATIADEAPNAVSGYDSMGNAILNMSAVGDKLSETLKELKQNSYDTLKAFDDLAQANGPQWLSDFFEVITFGIYNNNKEEAKATYEVWQDNWDEIYGGYKALVQDIVDEGLESNKTVRQSLSDTIINQIASSAMNDTKNKNVKENIASTGREIEKLYNEAFSGGSLDEAIDIATRIDFTADYMGLSFNEIRDDIKAELKDSFGDLDKETFDALLRATVQIMYDGEIDIYGLEDRIQQAIDESTDSDFKKYGKIVKESIGSLDPQIVSLLDQIGLLDEEWIKFIGDMINTGEINTVFHDLNGNLDLANGKLALLDKLAKITNESLTEDEQNRLEEEKKRLEEENKKLEKEKQEYLNKGHSVSKDDSANRVFDPEGKAENQRSTTNWQAGKGTVDVKALQDNESKSFTDAGKKLETNESRLKEINEQLDKNKQKTGDAQRAMDALFASIEDIKAPSFQEISDGVTEAVENFGALQDIIYQLEEDGGRLSLDSFQSLFGMLDQMEADMLNGSQFANQYGQAFWALADSMSVVNGELVMSTKGVEQLSNVQYLAYQQRIQEMINETEANIQMEQTRKAMLQAQITALQAAIEAQESGGDAQTAMEESLNASMVDIWNANLGNEQQALENSLKLNNEYLGKLAQQMAKRAEIYSGNYDDKEVKTSLTNQFIEDTTKMIGFDENGNIKDVDRAKSLLAGLQQQLDGVNNTIGALEARKAVLGNLLKVSPEGLKTFGKFGDAAEDNADKEADYNEQLERTLTLLEKIQGLQHTIDENKNFMDLYDNYNGTEYAKLMVQNLDLAKQQYEVYKDLFEMQQEMTDQAAGDLLDSPYGSMFKIDSNGDLGWADTSMYDRYLKLPDEMQKEVDELAQAFQEQRDALRDTELELVNYANALKEAQQAVVDLTIEAENTIVDALKNRESIMHEARKKALEDEIDMIEKAVEARQKAQEEEEDASSVYEAQEALRRATLDSSGKNNAQLLQLQQDLEDKQKEISEKRFEDDMDDRKQWLQDTIDAEQETYDYRLEMMTWYWEQVEVIMNQSTEYIMEFLIQWDEEYRQVSATQQEQLRQQWEFTFTQLKQITEMLDEPIINLKNNLMNVTSEVQNMNVQIQALPGSWSAATSAANGYAKAANAAASAYRNLASAQNSYNNAAQAAADAAKAGAGIVSGGGGGSVKLRLKANRNNPEFYNSKGQAIGCMNQKKGGTLTIKKENKSYFINGQGFYKMDNGNYIKIKDWTAYAKGGLVDFTGPAWVDGTKSKPEAFLNPYQTEQIGALADALDSRVINNMGDTSSVVTFGSINFNVASMSSPADGKKALEVFVKGANDLMAKKGIGTKINMNMR